MLVVKAPNCDWETAIAMRAESTKVYAESTKVCSFLPLAPLQCLPLSCGSAVVERCFATTFAGRTLLQSHRDDKLGIERFLHLTYDT